MSTQRQKVVVAMSGGVDSSVAACLLKEQGYEVIGLFMRTGRGGGGKDAAPDRHRGCCSAQDATDAREVAGKLGIHFYALNFEREFERIIDYFVDSYAEGQTPNPCVACNSELKFGRLFDYASSVGADLVATGHYARLRDAVGGTQLHRAVDRAKDQTYFLFGVDPTMLPRILFPLGELTKSEVRQQAERFGLPVSQKPESVEICFVPDRDYADIVRQRKPDAFVEGDVVDAAGAVLGRHRGIANYTIGQRRGLGIALGLPVYVTRLSPANHTVTIGSRRDLMHRELAAERVNWLIKPPEAPLRVQAQIRHQHQAADALLIPDASQTCRVVFDEPQLAITPGQAVAFYQGAHCLGGAWIQSTLD